MANTSQRRRFFHIAPSASRRSIATRGLVGRRSHSSGRPNVYVTTNPESWLLMFEDDGVYRTRAVDIWEVDVGRARMIPDENETADPDQDFIIEEAVHPSRLTLAATLTRRRNSYLWNGPRWGEY